MKPAIWHTRTLSQLSDRFRPAVLAPQSFRLLYAEQARLSAFLRHASGCCFFPMKKKKVRIWWEEEGEACGLHLDTESGCRRDRRFQTSSWSSGNTQVVINVNKTLLTSEISSYDISYLPSSTKILVSTLTSIVLACLNLSLLSLIMYLGTGIERVDPDHEANPCTSAALQTNSSEKLQQNRSHAVVGDTSVPKRPAWAVICKQSFPWSLLSPTLKGLKPSSGTARK